MTGVTPAWMLDRDDYEYHLYEVVCRHCKRCSVGQYDVTNIVHSKKCPLFKETH